MLKDISVSSSPKNRMGWPKGRPNLGRVKNPSPYTWPRLYGKEVKESIKNKCWELRKYLPSITRQI
jgi:hypothetical protein